MQMTAAYNSMMMDSKLNKKKQHADPSFGEYSCRLIKYVYIYTKVCITTVIIKFWYM